MKSKIFFFIILNALYNAWSYVPKSIEGKYKFNQINSFSCYSYWLDTTMKKNYGSEQNVLESFAPSAMVDEKGVLFTVTLHGLGLDGADFKIDKYEPSDTSIKTTSIHLYPWKRAGVSLNMSIEPNLSTYDDTDPQLFKDQIYNVFCPCIAQEIGSSDYICVFVYCPPTRFMNASKDTEGIMYFDFDKTSLSESAFSICRNSDNTIYRADHLRSCKDNDRYKFYPQVGSYQAWHASNYVHLNFIALQERLNYSTASLYKQFNLRQNKQSLKFLKGKWYCGGLSLCNRYIKKGDEVYGMFIMDGYTPLLTVEKEANDSWIEKASNWNFLYIENFTKGDSCYTTYNYDFCILEAEDGTKIWCILGFCASGQYSGLSNEYNWSITYCNWVTDKLALTLRSANVNNSNDKSPDYVQNVFYTTDIQRGTEVAVSSTDTSKSDLYRLYLNTHKICVYESPVTKHSYIIYAYCYPGKTKQLFLGYASFVIDSDHKVRLLTKTEFRDATGNSFGNFTSCSRIISMDCKNGHLWITFMSADSKTYRYFHIKASDLVGE